MSAAGLSGFPSARMIWGAREASSGRKRAAVARLLENSVRKMTVNTTIRMNRICEPPPNPATLSPSHAPSPLLLIAFERLRPPPNSSRISHGIFFACSQSRANFKGLKFTGNANSINAPAIAIIESSSLAAAGHRWISQSHSARGFRKIHKAATEKNTRQVPNSA